MNVHRIAQIAAEHHGVIHRADAGLSPQQWYRLHEQGVLVAVHPNVSHLVGATPTFEVRAAAALLATRPDSMLSHRSAAVVWGLVDPTPGPIDLIGPRRPAARSLAGVQLHRPRDQVGLRPIVRNDLRCTPLLRTLCDLGAVAPTEVTNAVGIALHRKIVRLDALLLTVIEHSEHGRHGVAALRSAIDEWAIDAEIADSVLEKAMDRLVRRFSLPTVEFHALIEGWEVDFRVVGTRVIIECDGWATHGADREQFERDRLRDAELTAAGWIIVRLTYRMITLTPEMAAARIRSVVAQWASSTPPDAA